MTNLKTGIVECWSSELQVTGYWMLDGGGSRMVTEECNAGLRHLIF
jgi:hypothetical protein